MDEPQKKLWGEWLLLRFYFPPSASHFVIVSLAWQLRSLWSSSFLEAIIHSLLRDIWAVLNWTDHDIFIDIDKGYCWAYFPLPTTRPR